MQSLHVAAEIAQPCPAIAAIAEAALLGELVTT